MPSCLVCRRWVILSVERPCTGFKAGQTVEKETVGGFSDVKGVSGVQ